MRTAIVVGGARSVEHVQRYMPTNYTAREVRGLGDTFILIEGEDVVGWTLDGYVLPRLASGLIWAREETGEERAIADAKARHPSSLPAR